MTAPAEPPPPPAAPMTREVIEWVCWLALVHMVAPDHGMLDHSLLVDAARFAIGVPAESLSTSKRFCAVELVADVQYAIEHAPEALRPRMRYWLARHEAELTRTQSSADRDWRLVAELHAARRRGLPYEKAFG